MPVLAVTRTADEVFLLVFGGIAVILVTARLVGQLFNRLGQPAVVGEVVGGLLLGPSVLGLLPGDPSALLFPPDIQPFLRILASFGLVIYMFIVGLELDPRTIRSERRAALSISLASIATPFALGALAGALVYSRHDMVDPTLIDTASDGTVDRLAFVLFCGLAICGSAFAILARILDERRLFRTRLGGVLLASTVVDDIVVWMLASVILAIAASSGLAGVPMVLGGLAAFVVFLFVVVRPALRRLMAERFRRDGGLSADVFAIILVGLLGSALFTTWLGISPILGAFFFGAAVPREGTARLFGEMNVRLESISVLVLLPVFFAVTGLGVDLSTLGVEGFVLLVVFVAVATVGKMFGAAVASSFNGVRGRRALAVGVLMNTRGLSELALLSIGRSIGVLDTTMFSVLVCTAITTTLISGPLLRLVYPDRLIEADIAETERNRAAEESAYRVLVLVDDPDTARLAVDVAVVLARSEPGAAIVLSRIAVAAPRTELGSGFMGDLMSMTSSLDELRELTAFVRDRGVEVVPQSQFTDDVSRELLAQVRRLRPHLVVLSGTTLGVTELAEQARAEGQVDVAVVHAPHGDERPARDATGPGPFRVHGGPEPDQTLAAELGVRLSIGAPGALAFEGGRRIQSLAAIGVELGARPLDPDRRHELERPSVVEVVTDRLTGDVRPERLTIAVRAYDAGVAPRRLDQLTPRLAGVRHAAG